MIVPNVEFYPFLSIDATTNGDVHGCVGAVDDREKSDDKPRRPIGFRMPERENTDPSWRLL